jgi:hypothetical protein
MNTKNITTFITIIVAITFFSFTDFNSIIQQDNMITKTEAKTNGVHLYKENFKQFNYYIETIGTVSIDKVELFDNKLRALYSYKQGSEIRNVVSDLILDNDGIFKGTCTTDINGKILFAVNTWLTFSNDGTAKGNWSWSGAPSKNDPIVKISNKK